jgi:hypothetical protein
MQRADTLPAESCRALYAHARKMLRSDPVAEYIVEQRRRNQLASDAPAEVRPDYRAMARHHKDAHEYPPGLEAAADYTLLGKRVLGDAELAAVADAAVKRATA